MVSGDQEGCFEPQFDPSGKFVYFLQESWLSGASGEPTRDLMRVGVDGKGLVEIASYELFESPLTFR